jgi:hypothetical protein
MVLPLVTVGDPDYVEHDWNTIFSNLGVLAYDTKIAAVIRLIGWIGMIGILAWFVKNSILTNPSVQESKAI